MLLKGKTMKMIRFESPKGTPLYIEISKIAGVREKEENETYVLVQAGIETEDWVVGENISIVLEKLHAA
jgi:hypothetical protein